MISSEHIGHGILVGGNRRRHSDVAVGIAVVSILDVGNRGPDDGLGGIDNRQFAGYKVNKVIVVVEGACRLKLGRNRDNGIRGSGYCILLREIIVDVIRNQRVVVDKALKGGVDRRRSIHRRAVGYNLVDRGNGQGRFLNLQRFAILQGEVIASGVAASGGVAIDGIAGSGVDVLAFRAGQLQLHVARAQVISCVPILHRVGEFGIGVAINLLLVNGHDGQRLLADRQVARDDGDVIVRVRQLAGMADSTGIGAGTFAINGARAGTGQSTGEGSLGITGSQRSAVIDGKGISRFIFAKGLGGSRHVQLHRTLGDLEVRRHQGEGVIV